MIFENLFKLILVDPLTKMDANILYVVSGYASATFTRIHILALKAKKEKFILNLIIGMPGSKNDHIAFLKLHEEFGDCFRGYYLNKSPPVHSKVYSWYNDDQPVIGFAGSANYSQSGFLSNNQLNQISYENPVLIRQFFESLVSLSIYMPEHQIVMPVNHKPEFSNATNASAGNVIWEIINKRVRISFLDRNGELPKVSGLNWGQREGREPNQAYLSIRGDVRESGFLPERGSHFSLITDDGENLDCVVAQDGGKAIHSTISNSLLGVYLRDRLGVPRGSLVTKDHLINYGRTDFTIEKVDEETFTLDLST